MDPTRHQICQYYGRFDIYNKSFLLKLIVQNSPLSKEFPKYAKIISGDKKKDEVNISCKEKPFVNKKLKFLFSTNLSLFRNQNKRGTFVYMCLSSELHFYFLLLTSLLLHWLLEFCREIVLLSKHSKTKFWFIKFTKLLYIEFKSLK